MLGNEYGKPLLFLERLTAAVLMQESSSLKSIHPFSNERATVKKTGKIIVKYNQFKPSQPVSLYHCNIIPMYHGTEQLKVKSSYLPLITEVSLRNHIIFNTTFHVT